jgi:hypothetical protein
MILARYLFPYGRVNLWEESIALNLFVHFGNVEFIRAIHGLRKDFSAAGNHNFLALMMREGSVN